MEFRPHTKELYLHCAATQYCTDCKYRIGCPIRHSFYSKGLKTDIDFEVLIQSLELEFQSSVGEDTALDATNSIRYKYYTEKRINPQFSYL